jgi:hypothetical protein
MLREHPARYVRRDLPVICSPLPASSRPLSARVTLAWPASLPRPDPAFKDRDAFGCFTAWLGLPRSGPILEGPGADLPSPWLGSAPEANARNAHAYLRTIRRRSITRFGGRHLGLPHHQERYGQPAVTAGGCGAAPPVLRWRPAHDVAPSFARGHAERRRSGPVPSRPSSSTLAPSPPGRAGSVGRALNPDR